jgi:OOP family OmpA-OmpF porin
MNWRMNKKVMGSGALLVLCAAAPGLASAQMDYSNIVHESYIGVGAGQSKNKDVPDSWDDTDTAWKAFIGWDANKIFGLEAGYVDLGKWNGPAGAGEISGKGWNIDARLGVPFFENRASVYLKGGTFYGDTKVDAFGFSRSESKWDWTYGAGAEYDFTKNFGARAEWENFKLKNDAIQDQSVDLISASLVWKFK